MRLVVAAALTGAGTGCRSFTGVGTLAVATPAGATRQPDRTLARPMSRVAAGLLVATEDALDKLPNAPARTDPPGLLARLVGGAASGLIVARRPAATPDALDTVVCVATGAAAALAATFAGLRWREWAADRWGSTWGAAGLEDVAALGLAVVGANLVRDPFALSGRRVPDIGEHG
jgi:uncharacterized membrane protein